MNEQTPIVNARFDDYELRVWQNPDGYLVITGDYKADYERHAFETWVDVLNYLARIENLVISN